MFPKEFSDICLKLPRQKSEVIKICHQYSTSKEDSVYKSHLFQVRKTKVIKALRWLKNHHPGYDTIEITEKNLSWMSGEEDVLVDTRIKYSPEKIIENTLYSEVESVSEHQTEYRKQKIDEFGLAIQTHQNHHNAMGKKIIEQIKTDTLKKRPHVPILNFPQISDSPIDEFQTPNVFADCYPW